MHLTKKYFALLSIFIFCNTLISGCATQYHRGDGVVISEKKIKEKDMQPHNGTKTGAVIGGTVGAVGGAAVGGFLGLCVSAFSGGTAPILVVGTLGGAAIGSIIVGATGGTIGGGLGYLADVSSANAATYQFVVQPKNESHPLTITQYGTPIPLHSEVHILEKDHVIFIKQN